MSAAEHAILVVEDSDDDFLFFRRACRQSKLKLDIKRARTAAEARAYLDELSGDPDAAWPMVIFLDLNLPGTDGRELLRELKGADHLKILPVVIFSTSAASADVRFCYAHHANAYHHKSLDYNEMKEELVDILEYWTSRARSPTGIR